MSLPKSQVRMSVDEYIESEKDGTVRHEYLDGEVYAMSGASKRHNRIANNLTIDLTMRLRGGPCQIFMYKNPRTAAPEHYAMVGMARP